MLNAVSHLKGEGSNALHRQRGILFHSPLYCEEVIMTRNINEQTLEIVSDFNSVLEDISVAVAQLPNNVCFVCLTHVFSRCLCSMTHRFSPLRLPLVDRVVVGHSQPHRVCVPVFVCLHGM